MTEARTMTFTASLREGMRAEIREALAFTRAAAGGGRRNRADRPFCVLTPLGRVHADRLAAALAAIGSVVVRRTPVPRWSRVSSLLYTTSVDEFRVRKAWAYELLWQSRFPDDEAERWEFANEAAYLRLLERKYLVRGLFPSRLVTVTAPCFRRRLRLHVFHLPDPGRMSTEARIVERAIGFTPAP